MSRGFAWGAVVLALARWPVAWGADLPPAPSVSTQEGIRTGTPMAVTLVGGQELEGTFLGSQAGLVRIATGEGIREVPLALVVEARVEGAPLPVDSFQRLAREWADTHLPQDLRTPSPGVAGALSAAWAGAGYLALGDPRSFAGWSALEGVVIGTGLLMWFEAGPGASAPFVALDVLLHGVAVQDVAGEAARRRRRVAFGVVPGQESGPLLVASVGPRGWTAPSEMGRIEGPGMGPGLDR